MKAWVNKRYGPGLEVLKLRDLPDPECGDEEVLIDIKAISLNAYDWHNMKGVPGIFRLTSGLFVPKNPICGSDAAGVVRRVGRKVTDFRPGDRVFGEFHLGGFAQSISVKTDLLVPVTDSLTFEQAAALPMAGATALQGLRNRGRITKGQKVLINGASGGVGHFAVQIAKLYDTEVTAICSGGNADLVRSIGADFVIDYNREDLTRLGREFDLILDLVGNLRAGSLRRMLRPEGTAVVIGFTSWGRLIPIAMRSRKTPEPGRKNLSLMVTDTTADDLRFLRDLVAEGKMNPIVDRRYDFDSLPEAMAHLETGRARGKIVVTN